MITNLTSRFLLRNSIKTSAGRIGMMARTRMMSSSAHGSGTGKSIESHGGEHAEPPAKLHPPEYLKVAESWPHEEYSPENYGSIDEANKVYPETKEDLQLIASSFDEPEPASFTTPAWLVTFGSLALVMLAYRISEGYTRQVEEGKLKEHPITALVDKLLKGNSADHAIAFDKESLPRRKQYADDLLILNGRPSLGNNPPQRWTIPLDRCSDFIVPVGSHVQNIEEGRIYSWQEHDDEKK